MGIKSYSISMFDQQSRTRLRDKLDYEHWMLNELEEEVDVFPEELGGMVIRNGNIAAREVKVAACISQSRVEDVIERMYPLVFAASYKCLDMIMEWILEENTGTYSHQWMYSYKIQELNEKFHTGNLQLPPPLAQNKDIFERILRLYNRLVDHRHAVVHRHKFDVTNGVFEVEDDSGIRYAFETVQLFSIAKVATVGADTLLKNSLSEEWEREIKQYIDNLSFIHEMNTFDVAAPWSPTIEYHVEANEQNPPKWNVDMDVVQQADDSTPSTEGYYLKIVGEVDGQTVSEWVIPSELVDEKGELELNKDSSDFANYRV